MTPTDSSNTNTWAVQHVLALVEIWALVAQHSGFVGAWRLTAVCRTSRAGVKEWLGTLPGLVVSGGHDRDEPVSEVWRLDPATLQWVPMPALLAARCAHACCVVRGALVVLGGYITDEEEITSTVEILSPGGEDRVFTDFPALSCGGITEANVIAVEESNSAAGQVLLLGGRDEEDDVLSTTVHLVDIATGVCTPQAALLSSRYGSATVRIPDGRIACAGGGRYDRGIRVVGALALAEVWGPPASGSSNAAWTWTQLPAMSVGRHGSCGCVMSDGRFAVLGGVSNNNGSTSSCEALMVDKDAHWHSLPPMHYARCYFACAAVARCIIVAGGQGTTPAEVYDEALNRWIQLPYEVPGGNTHLSEMGSALL
jgi:hypothetical protein